MSSTGELSFQLYKWLSAMQVITTGQKYKSNGNIQLDSKTHEELSSGQLMAKLVQTLARQLNVQLNGALLSSTKKSNTPASRVYNWNVLSQSFSKIGIILSKQMQKEITSGNFEELKRFLIEIQRKMIPKKIQKAQPPKQQPPEQADFIKIQKYNSYHQCQNVIEVIVKMISKTCGLTVKQSFTTLQDNLKYFSHMIVKGIKNSYDEIIGFFKTMIETMPHLMYLAEKDPEKDTTLIIQLIKPSLISRQPEVALFGSNAFCSLIYESMKYNDKNLVYQILSSQTVGFDFIYMGVKRHPHLVVEYFDFLHPLIQNTYKQFFEVHLKNIINNQADYIKTIIILLEGIKSNQQATKSVIDCGLVKNWVKMCEEQFNLPSIRKQFPSMPNAQISNQDAKILSLELMCDLWKIFSSVLDEKQAQDLLMRGIQELKRNTRKDNYLIKISALNRLFDFLDYLASQKNRMAAVVYKKMIFLLFENHQDMELRQAILQNFMLTFKRFPTIPIEFLLGPLLRQLKKQQGESYVLNIFDFEFFVQIFKHPKVEADQALNYLEYFTKLYTKNIIYSGVVIRVIELLCARFCEQQAIMQYIIKNAQNNLNVYGMLAIGKKQYLNGRQEKLMNSQKKSLVIELLKYYIKLENQFITNSLKSRVIKLYVSWLDTKRHDDKGLYYLLTLFGDVDELVMKQRIQKENNKFDQNLMTLSGNRQNQQAKSKLNSLANSHSTPQSFNPFIQSQVNQGYINSQSRKIQESNIWRDETQIYTNRYNNYEGTPQRPNQNKKYSQRLFKPQTVDSKTLEHIQVYRNKFRRESQKKQELLQKSTNSQIIPKVNQNQLMQRQIAMGYSKFVKPQQLFYEFDTVKTKYLKEETQMIQIEQLQDRDIISVNAVLKRYEKQIQSLFYKYTAIGSVNNRAPTQQKVFMSFTELNRMLKQKDVSKLPKIVINEIITFINKKKKYNINVLVGVEEKQFCQFLILFANLYLKQEKMDKDEPFGLKLQKILLKMFQGQFFSRDLNDRKANQWFLANKIPKLQKEEQQRIQAPQGYKKITVNETVQQCVIPLAEDFNIPESYQVCFSVLNQFFDEKFKFYVFPPVTKIKSMTRIVPIGKVPKPRIPQNLTEKVLKKSAQILTQSNKVLINRQKINGKLNEDDKDGFNLEDNANINLKGNPLVKVSSATRSKSHKEVKKRANKTEFLDSDQIIKKHKQQQEYAKKLRQELQVIKKQKEKKEQQKKQKKQIQQLQKMKKQQKHKKYLQQNRKKIQQKKQKEEQQKKEQQAKEQELKEKRKLEMKSKEKNFLEKMQKQIQDKKQKFNEKQKQKQQNLKKIQRIQKKSKSLVNAMQKQPNAQKEKERRLTEAINNGKQLMTILEQYQKQIKMLFQEYWNWKTKQIELKQIALMMKNFKISPEYLTPKNIVETFKSHAKGDALTIQDFKKLLIKYCYKSQKLNQQVSSDTEKQFSPKQLNKFLQQNFYMKQLNYVDVIKKAKLQKL